jgi:hypothetical protein
MEPPEIVPMPTFPEPETITLEVGAAAADDLPGVPLARKKLTIPQKRPATVAMAPITYVQRGAPEFEADFLKLIFLISLRINLDEFLKTYTRRLTDTTLAVCVRNARGP